MAGANEEYMKAKRSGRYYEHPDQKKIFDEGPPLPEIKEKPFWKKWDWKKIGLWILIGFIALTAFRWFNAPQKERDEVKEAIGIGEFIGNDQIEDKIEIVEDGTNVQPPKIVEKPKVIIKEVIKKVYVKDPQWKQDQALAFAKIKAWERITKKVVEEFFATPVQNGYKRTLCISLDGERHCRTISGSVKTQHNGLLRRR